MLNVWKQKILPFSSEFCNHILILKNHIHTLHYCITLQFLLIKLLNCSNKFTRFWLRIWNALTFGFGFGFGYNKLKFRYIRFWFKFRCRSITSLDPKLEQDKSLRGSLDPKQELACRIINILFYIQ